MAKRVTQHNSHDTQWVFDGYDIAEKNDTRHFEMPHDFFHFVNVPPNVLRSQVEVFTCKVKP
jgi:hypothetical protein